MTGLALTTEFADLQQLLAKYEDVCAAMAGDVAAQHLAATYRLYDCLSFILAKMKQDIESHAFQRIITHQRYAHANRLFAALEQTSNALQRDKPVQILFFAPGASVDYNALEVAMTIRGYSHCAKELVARKLKFYTHSEHAVLRPSSHSPNEDGLVAIDEVDTDGKTVTKYYIRKDGHFLEVDPSSNKGTADAAKKGDGDI